MPTSPDQDWLFVDSSAREKVLEHLFIGDLLRCLWRKGMRDAEVLRVEVDRGGYDLVVDCNGTLRHIQLKSSHRAGAARHVGINVNLARKPSGCVVWILFDAVTMTLGPFLWFGGRPGEPLPILGDRIGRHTKADSLGRKNERPNIRVVSKRQFQELATIDDLVKTLFGSVRKAKLPPQTNRP